MAIESILCPLCGSTAVRRLELAHTTVWACATADCGLQFAAPQPDETALARAYSNLYYPSEAGKKVSFENTPDDVLRQMFLRLEARIGRLSGLTIMDYGCGRGGLLRVARSFGLCGAGVEADPQARSIASSLPGISVYASVDDLVLAEPRAIFDAIVMWTVIEHLRMPWADLARLRTLLRPGGWLLISTMDIRCFRARIERERWENYENPTHLYYFDRISLARAIREAGFSDSCEWRLKLRHKHHGFLRRWAYSLCFSVKMADGLFFLCRQDEAHAATLDKARTIERVAQTEFVASYPKISTNKELG